MNRLESALAQPYVAADARDALARAQTEAVDTDVQALATELGIAEVLHFTTHPGALGVLASGSLQCRDRLPQEKLLEYVYEPNTGVRKDPNWTGFVNLSITRVNDWMFSTSSNRRSGQDIFWVVLSFEPSILADPGVVFTTTNNIYPSCRRQAHEAGLAAQFAPEVRGRYSSLQTRLLKAANQPTDRQAEVLYPDAISTQRLQRVYVNQPEHREDILGLYSALSVPVEVPVICAPEVFR